MSAIDWIVLSAVALLVVSALRKVIRGRTGCRGNCAGCASCGGCGGRKNLPLRKKKMV